MADNIEVGLELKDNMSAALGNVAKAISSFATKVDSGLTKVSDALDEVQASMRGMATTATATMPKASSAMKETVTRAEQLRRTLTTLNDVAGKPLQLGNINYAGVDKLTAKLKELQQNIVDTNTKSTKGLTVAITAVQGPGKVSPTGKEDAINFGATQSKALSLIGQADILRQKFNEAMRAASVGSEEAAKSAAKLAIQLANVEAEAKGVEASYQRGLQQIGQLTAKANSELTRLYGQSAKGMLVTPKDLFPTQAQTQLDSLNSRIRDIAEQRVEIRAVTDTFRQFGNVFPFLNKNLDATDAHIIGMVNSLPRLRYAMYDISRNATIAGAAMIAGFAGGAAVAIDYQRKFADVLRTTGIDQTTEAASKLKQQFIELKQSLPVSFGQLTEIGTLAGQLDIANSSVANFTKTVAMFSATTDVNVSDAATAFGRLDKLVYGVDGQFEKLASSILAVGTSAVATEGQIIRVSQQISSIANLAGFSAAEIIGFSSALASVGISPELARGLVTRTFSSINTAAAAGGAQLERFGKVAGISGAEFAGAWKQDAAGTFVKFLKGINEDGTVAEQTLRELGITSIRDIPSLLKLAQSHEEVARQLGIASEGFANGTELQKQYDVIASTVAEKLKKLAGNFEVLIATIGETANGFGLVIDVGIKFLQILTDLAKNPFGQALLNLAGLFLLVGGGLSLFTGVLTKAIAGFSAAATGSISFRTTMNLLRMDLNGLAASGEVVALTNGQMAASSALTTARFNAESGSISAQIGLLRARAAVLRENIAAMSLAQKASLAAGFVGIALAAAGAISQLVTELNKSSGTKATEFFGDISSVLAGVKEDTLAWRGATEQARKEYETFTVTINDSNNATSDAVSAVKDAAGSQDAYGVSLSNATSQIESQTVAIGENTKAAIEALKIQKLTDPNGALVQLFQDPALAEAAKSAGYDIGAILATGASEGADQGLIAVREAIAKLGTQTAGGNIAIQGMDVEKTRAALQLIEQTYSSMIGLDGVIRGVSAAELSASGSTDDLTSAIANLNEQFFESENLAIKQNSALDDLGQAIANNGANFNILTAAGRENQAAMIAAMTAISDNAGSPVQAAANLQALYNTMLAAGVPASQMIMLSNAIASLGGATVPATASMTPFSNGLKKVKTGAASAAKQIRTLVDYANDLQSTFSRAFDIRFGSQGAMDDVVSSFASMSKSMEDARRSLASLQADIQSLTADKALKEYFLEVAIAYGDTLRADQLRAELAQISNDIAETQADLNDAQAQASTSLSGNSQAAIDNRSEIRNIVQGYAEYIAALAAAGASQDTLSAATANARADFLAQAKALGFSEAELQSYLAAFDDMGTIVGGVTPGVTIAFNTNPALQALAELEAKAKSTASSITNAFDDVDTEIPPPNNEPAKKSLLELLGLGKSIQTDAFGPLKSGYVFAPIDTTKPKSSLQELGLQSSNTTTNILTDWQTKMGLVPTTISNQTNPVIQSLTPWLNSSKTTTTNILTDWQTKMGLVPSAVNFSTPLINQSFGAWRSSSENAANGVTSSWSNTASQIPGKISSNSGQVNNVFGTWRNYGQSAGNDVSSTWSNAASNAPTYVSNQNGRIYSSFRSLGTNAKSGWNSVLGGVSSAIRNFFGWAEGGYTGAGGKYDVAGLVHKGEYVVPKDQVNQATKKPYFMEQTPQYYTGGYAGTQQNMPSTMMVELSPYDRKLLASAGNVQLRLDGKVVAQATNAVNLVSAQRGSN